MYTDAYKLLQLHFPSSIYSARLKLKLIELTKYAQTYCRNVNSIQKWSSNVAGNSQIPVIRR